MAAGRIINVFIEPNPNCPEGCSQRFQATSESRPVTWIRYSTGGDDTMLCEVTGWSSEKDGTPCPARAVGVEDSGAGVVTLVYGGDWGLRIQPRDGSAPFGEPYLLLDAASIVD